MPERAGEPGEVDAAASTLAPSPSGGASLAREDAAPVASVREGWAALRASEDRYRRLVAHAVDVVFHVRLLPERAVEYVGPGVEAISGYSPDEVAVRLQDGTGLIHPDDQPRARHLLLEARADAEPVRLRWLARDGSVRWMEHRGGPVHDEHGRLVAVEGVARDLTHVVEIEEQLAHHALHDPLTGLANRHLLRDHLDQALRRRRRRPGARDIAVLLLDLDRFKVVNDSLGHPAGDALLVAVSRRIRRVLRPADVVARFGGDEFCILLEDLREPQEAARVAERVAAAFTAPFVIGGDEVFSSATIGIAFAGHADDAPDDLLRHADSAMYRAKAQTAGGYEIFDDDTRTQVGERLRTETALRRAAGNGELVVVLQPVVDLATATVTGAEALLRWDRPGHGLQPAAAFVGLAEESGLIVDIGSWVFEQVCRTSVDWRARHPLLPVRFGVNLAAAQLERPGFVDDVAGMLAATGADPASLWLEMTETTLMADPEASLRQLQALRRLGLELAVDDFGTGYSSLAYLKRFPVDVLKIDKSFVDDVDTDPEDAAIVRATIQLAASLGLRVVAEGVETASQRHALQMLGCGYAQGYHFGEPMPAAEFEVAALATLHG